MSWFDDTVARRQPSTLLALTHGGPVKTLIPALVQSRGFDFAPGVEFSSSRVLNCSVTIVEVDDGVASGGTIRSYADASYLLDTVDASASGDAELADRVISGSSAA